MYRAWGTVDDLCLVNQQQFTDEQAAMTSTLAQWLGQTSATVDGAWDDELGSSGGNGRRRNRARTGPLSR